jgi:adenylate cyclase, class 2
MNIEYEATFLNINKEKIRKKLKNIGAKLIKPEFLQKRVVFDIPNLQVEKVKKPNSPTIRDLSPFSNKKIYGWLRVRDEGDKITMSFKSVNGDKIQNQKEINLTINNFKKGVELLKIIGCRKKSYQETKREIWKFDNVEICIDEWPFLEPFVEIEGKSEKKVIEVSKKLKLNYSKAWFCATDLIYNKKYGIPLEIINHKIPKIVFNMKNPFLKIKNKQKIYGKKQQDR